MAEKDKKYYWLKLKRDFFYDNAIILLKAQKDGSSLIICYLKMLCMSIPSGRIDMSRNRLARRLDMSVEELEKALEILQFYQLVFDDDEILVLPYVKKETVASSTEKEGRDRNSSDYKNWRMAVYMKDNFTCQSCGIRGVELNAHHIKSWRSFPEERFNIDNGITLCVDCHKKIHRRKK